MVGDGHQPYSRVLYTHYKDSLFSRWDDHPQYKELELIDPGTLGVWGADLLSEWFIGHLKPHPFVAMPVLPRIMGKSFQPTKPWRPLVP